MVGRSERCFKRPRGRRRGHGADDRREREGGREGREKSEHAIAMGLAVAVAVAVAEAEAVALAVGFGKGTAGQVER
jgi:hypothetical protein